MKRFTAILLSALMAAMPVAAPNSVAEATDISRKNPPSVLPAIREWTDAAGDFTVDANTRLVDHPGSGAAELTAGFFREACGKELAVAAASSGSNEIRFEKTEALPKAVDDEGYTLEITKDAATVRARTDTGLLYGGITLVQMCFGEGGGEKIRCGSAVDYPAYKTRSGMLDVARAWIPIEYVEQITKYMAWFKLNEIHLHLSDNPGFRIESDVPGLSTVVNGERQYYTKEEYREYQRRMLKYGVSVVSEIDTPSHSAPFARVTSGGPAMKNGKYLDITEEHFDETLEFIKKLWAEYITGDDPVFINKVVHIGTDEYPKGNEEQMRKYTAALAEYVYSQRKTPRNWAFLGPNGEPGETPIPNYIQASMWDNGISGLEQLVEGGYDIVNNLNARLYVVPAENRSNGFPDRLNIEGLYKTWQVHDFSGWSTVKSVEPGYEHLLGAGFCLWNDYHQSNYGVTQYDIFDRLRDMACIVAEKTWAGDDGGKGDCDFFLERAALQGKRSGGADPGFHALAGGAEIDFSKPLPEGFAVHGEISQGRLLLDGTSCLSAERGGLGFPNTLEITLCLDEIPNTPLMTGAGTELYADCDGKGHLGYKCGGYTFAFDYSLPAGEETKLLFTCDSAHTRLLVNDSLVYEAENIKNRAGNRVDTFNVPLETVGRGAKGYICSIRISGEATGLADFAVNANLALGKKVTVSGSEVDYTFFPEWAVDGSMATRASLARDKDEQWLQVDLGKEFEVGKAEIDYFESISSFDLFVSADGKEYTKVYELRGGEDRLKKKYSCEFTPTRARYVKYVQNKRFYVAQWNTYYSGGISEFRVFEAYDSGVTELVSRAKTTLVGDVVKTEAGKKAKAALDKLEAYLNRETVYKGNLELLAGELKEALSAIDGYVPGDVNSNGKIDAADYAMAKRAFLKTYTLSEEQTGRADINKNGKVDASEYAMIKRHVLKTYVIPGAEGK